MPKYVAFSCRNISKNNYGGNTRPMTYSATMWNHISLKIHYWRERSDEVDFVIVRQGETIALEVKSGRRGMNSGLPKFCANFHPKRALVIGTDGIPFEDFFRMRIEDLF